MNELDRRLVGLASGQPHLGKGQVPALERWRAGLQRGDLATVAAAVSPGPDAERDESSDGSTSEADAELPNPTCC